MIPVDPGIVGDHWVPVHMDHIPYITDLFFALILAFGRHALVLGIHRASFEQDVLLAFDHAFALDRCVFVSNTFVLSHRSLFPVSFI